MADNTGTGTNTTAADAAADAVAFLHAYDIDTRRGFAPRPDPVPSLAHVAAFRPYESLAAELPALLRAAQLRPAVDALNASGAADHAQLAAMAKALASEGERRRALLLLAGLANAYVWGGGGDTVPRARVPACLAVPLHRVAARLGTRPMLSHMSNCLYNWRLRLPPPLGSGDAVTEESHGPHLRAEDLALAFSFTGAEDERFFYLRTLEIEFLGGPALVDLEATRRGLGRFVESPAESEAETESEAAACAAAAAALGRVRAAVLAMKAVLLSMPKRVDPRFFYHNLRPYLSGWKNNPTLPDGVVYEGVGSGGEDVRLQFSGGSAAQSSVVAAIDLYLGVDFGQPDAAAGEQHAFLVEMREYMPRRHREFLNALEAAGPSPIRRYVARRRQRQHQAAAAGAGGGDDDDELLRAYDGCLDALASFRRAHLGVVGHYILSQQQQQQQQQQEQQQPQPGEDGGAAAGLERAAGGKGTGGMPLLAFLKPLRDVTVAARFDGGGGEREEGEEDDDADGGDGNVRDL